MRLAADYSDQWFSNKKFEFNVYYVCRAGGSANECCTLIESLKWTRFHDLPFAIKQRWYCGYCRAKYKTKFGVLCEMRIGTQAMYCKAEIPPSDLQDAKFMKIEDELKTFKTPEELIMATPRSSRWTRGPSSPRSLATMATSSST